jgi:hypothetical protein
MTAMGSRPPTLVWFRRSRAAGAWLFLLLLSLVALERRLAEAHYNLRSAAPGVESADALDGDEIRVRLVVLNDDKVPSLPIAGSVLAPRTVVTRTPRVDRVPLGRPAPRGPPPPVLPAA